VSVDDTPEGQTGWDQRYASARSLWTGRPNPVLVRVVDACAGLPGHALDVGCGEGGDAVWLAGRGWQVTGVDISSVALGRAAVAARAANVEGRTSWVHADLATEPLPAGPWDLVNAQYLHFRPAERPELWAALAAGVAPAGTLLVVAHDRTDPHVAPHLAGAPNHPAAADRAIRFHGADEVIAALGDGWRVLYAGPVHRTRPNAHEAAAVDLVVHAVRAGVA